MIVHNTNQYEQATYSQYEQATYNQYEQATYSQLSMTHNHFSGSCSGFKPVGRSRHFWHLSQATQSSAISCGAATAVGIISRAALFSAIGNEPRSSVLRCPASEWLTTLLPLGLSFTLAPK